MSEYHKQADAACGLVHVIFSADDVYTNYRYKECLTTINIFSNFFFFNMNNLAQPGDLLSSSACSGFLTDKS